MVPNVTMNQFVEAGDLALKAKSRTPLLRSLNS